MFIAQVNTDKPDDGCFCKAFSNLDDVRVFIRESAASFRRWDSGVKCTAVIVRSGMTLGQGKRVEC